MVYNRFGARPKFEPSRIGQEAPVNVLVIREVAFIKQAKPPEDFRFEKSCCETGTENVVRPVKLPNINLPHTDVISGPIWHYSSSYGVDDRRKLTEQNLRGQTYGTAAPFSSSSVIARTSTSTQSFSNAVSLFSKNRYSPVAAVIPWLTALANPGLRLLTITFACGWFVLSSWTV